MIDIEYILRCAAQQHLDDSRSPVVPNITLMAISFPRPLRSTPPTPMDSELNVHEAPEFTSHSAPENVGSVSYGGIFSASHHFTVAGGTFTNITHNQFTMSPGDRFLVDDIGLEARLDAIGCLCGRSSVRRIYSPRVVGQEGDMTAAMNSGDDGAQEEWRGDIGSAHTEDVMPEDDIRFPRHIAHADSQSAADMVYRDTINAQDASRTASPTSDVPNSRSCVPTRLFPWFTPSCTGSMLLDLASDVTHRICLIPLEAPSFIQPVVCELAEGLNSPLRIGCPRDEPYPRVAYGERLEQCHAELYVIPGPRFFLRDPAGRGICLNGRNLATRNVSDLHTINDGDIIQLNIRYSDRLGITHPATRLKIEILPRQNNNSVHSAGTTISPTTTGIPEASNTPDGCTLVQFIDFSDPPSFSTVLCQLTDDARPVQLRRSPAGNASSASSAITFNSKTVSRRHAALWSEEGQVFILDQHSTHGTFLNGDRLVPGRTSENAKLLIDGDTLRIGAVDERAAIRGITAKLRILRIAW
ncbi:hypothetical protein B0H13DRAFT_2083750 [Mycena leptocephala]|nr:hypothetical protein B0H13DRAFT_2083750 [Mycena leptocephala]